ncbi:hypothetical protein, partial [Burkholderia sp. Ac-20392]|uniref:hypothetical protein n=1 Tax=Burkholderia sp. Ac-20392 TaxID=2703905 RepID=UPI00197EE370
MSPPAASSRGVSWYCFPSKGAAARLAGRTPNAMQFNAMRCTRQALAAARADRRRGVRRVARE